MRFFIRFNISLQTIILTLIVVIVLITGITITRLSFLNSKKSVDILTNELLDEVNHHINDILSFHFKAAISINQSNAELISKNIIDYHNQDALIKNFKNQIVITNSVSSIYFGNVQGGLANFGRDINTNTNYIMKSEGFVSGSLIKYSINSQGRSDTILSKIASFDCRNRPWYKIAINNNNLQWSDVYILSTGHYLTITASHAVYDEKTKKLIGVVATDLFLPHLSESLSNIRIGKNGSSFIVDNNGFLVATSNKIRLHHHIRANSTESIRVKAIESNSQIIQEIANKVQDFYLINKKTFTEVKVNNDYYFAQINPFKINDSVSWHIVTILPHKDYLEQIQINNKKTLIILLLILLIAILIGFIASKIISKPIKQLQLIASHISKGNFNFKASPSWVKETNLLGIEINSMGDALLKTINKLELARIDAEKANKAKTDFLSNMSHELRTPLNGVIGFTDLLLEQPLEPIHKQYVKNAYDSGQALLKMINDILNFSRMESGKLELNNTPVNLPVLLQEIVQISNKETVINRNSLTLIHKHSTPDIIFTDEFQLKQVLLNLTNNAIKFTQNGSVSISVTFEPENDNYGSFEFIITDTGIGISNEIKKKLFTLFSQGDDSNTKQYIGTGLGLIISQKIIAAMGSVLHFKNEEKNGCSFYFTIHTRYENKQISIQRPTIGLFSSILDNKLSVLVVEDVLLNRILIVELIKSIIPNAEIITAQNGLEAIEKFKKYHSQVIFMDIQMPVMDGYEASIKIREIESMIGTRPVIIALTANAIQGTSERCYDSGIDYYQTKPVNKVEIENILRNITNY